MIPLTDARYCDLFHEKPTKGGVFITGDDLADLIGVLRSFHVEAVSGSAVTEKKVHDFWSDSSDLVRHDLAFVEAGRESGLSLLADALAKQAARRSADGGDEQEFLSDFFQPFPQNRDSRRACPRVLAELRARDLWPWSQKGR